MAASANEVIMKMASASMAWWQYQEEEENGKYQ
jgi:hypothetical protein